MTVSVSRSATDGLPVRGRELDGPSQPLQVVLAGDGLDAERGEVRRPPLDVEQPTSRTVGRQRAGRGATTAALEASVARWNFDSPANSPPTERP